MDDVMLAIQARTLHSFVQPPGQDMLAEIAKEINARELPKPKIDKFGLLIPPNEEECLTAPNYQLKLPGADKP
jgi:hypothetical protein